MRRNAQLDSDGDKNWTTGDEIAFLREYAAAGRIDVVRGWLRGSALRSDWGTISDPRRVIAVAREILGLADHIPPAVPALVQ